MRVARQQLVETVAGDAVLGGVGLDVVLIDGDQRGEVLAPVADDADLRDIGRSGDETLDGRRCDVLAAGGDDEVLLAAGNSEKADIVDLTQIAGVLPTVGGQGLGGLGGHLVILAHDVAAAVEHLAVVAGLLLDSGTGGPDPTEAVVVLPVDVGEGRVLGHTDAFEDEYARRVEELADGRIERCGAADAPAHPATERGPDLGKDQFGGETVLEPGEERDGFLGEQVIADPIADIAGPVEELEGDAALGARAGEDLGVDLLVDSRNAWEPVRFGDLEVLADGVDGAGKRRIAAGEQRCEDAGSGKDMRQR